MLKTSVCLAVVLAVVPVRLGAQNPDLSAQLRQAAWPIRTTAPNGGFDDLEPLEKAIGPARLVAMGEATHGTSEFFSLNRIYRMLVERMGFTVFAMEMPWLSGRAIDTYVTTGQGNARAILAGSFPVWDNHEVLDLIEWMRAYNAAPGSHARLRFVGIDMQEDNPSALARLIPAPDAPRVSCLTSLSNVRSALSDERRNVLDASKRSARRCVGRCDVRPPAYRDDWLEAV